MSRLAAARMASRIKATAETNRAVEAIAAQHRAEDELEQAKVAIRRRGFAVYDRADGLTVVGTRAMTREEVIERAQRYREERR